MLYISREEALAKVTTERAQAVADELGIDLGKIGHGPVFDATEYAEAHPHKIYTGVEGFRNALIVELEHAGGMGPETDVVHGVCAVAGRIVLAHLREGPQYYVLLDKYVEEIPLKNPLRLVHVFGPAVNLNTMADELVRRRLVAESDLNHLPDAAVHMPEDEADRVWLALHIRGVLPHLWQKAVDVELEHAGLTGEDTDVSGGDNVVVARIALAHLLKDIDYYDNLDIVEGLLEEHYHGVLQNVMK